MRPVRKGRASLELDVAAVALLVAAVAVYIGARRLRRKADDLATAGEQLHQLAKHNGEQARRIADLEAERPTEMFEAMRREMGEALIELDGPAGADVDLRRGACGMPNPALAEPPGEGDVVVLPRAEGEPRLETE